MSPRQKRAVQWVFYGGLTILLLLITTGLLRQILPGSVTTRVAYNSEGYLFAVVLGSWIQFALPRIRPHRRLPWALVVAAFWAAVGLGLLASDLPSRLRTLNEAALGLAVVIPYVTLTRPVRRGAVWAVPVLIGMTIWAVLWAPDSWIIDQAETFGFVVLAVLTFGVFDRSLLEPAAVVRRGTRVAWYAFMLLEPFVVSGLGVALRDGDGAHALALRYLGRIHESFVGLLLVALIIYLTRPRPNREVESGSAPSSEVVHDTAPEGARHDG